MVRMVIGAIMLFAATLMVIVYAVRTLSGQSDSVPLPLELLLIMLAVYGVGGAALFWWGRRAFRSKRRFRKLALAFGDTLNAADTSLWDADGPSPTHEQSQIAYGVPLAADEEIIVRLIPENSEKLYHHRGQVAAVTDRRLLFLLPQRAGVSKNLDDYYVVKSIPHEQVTEVSHRKGFALGGMLAGIILMGVAVGVALGGITGELIGPGVIFIPLLAGPSGLTLALGLRRRVLVFSTPYGDLHWQSGPMKVRKTQPMVAKVRDIYELRQTPVHGVSKMLAY